MHGCGNPLDSVEDRSRQENVEGEGEQFSVFTQHVQSILTAIDEGMSPYYQQLSQRVIHCSEKLARSG